MNLYSVRFDNLACGHIPFTYSDMSESKNYSLCGRIINEYTSRMRKWPQLLTPPRICKTCMRVSRLSPKVEIGKKE